MATRNIVPRGNGEGQLGTAAKHWAKLFADVIHEGANLGNNASLGYRQPSTAYTVGQIAYHSALPTGYYLECTTPGITGSGDITPSSTIGGTIQDGSVVWRVLSKDCNLRILTKNEDYVTDLNDTIKIGIYRTHGDNKTANTPPNIGAGGGYGVCIVTPISTNTPNNVIQLFYSAHGSTLWQRQKKGDDGWTSWQQQEAIVAKSIGANGYIKYASGLIMQWGSIEADSMNTIDTGVYTQKAWPLPISMSQCVFATVVPWTLRREASPYIGAYGYAVAKSTKSFEINYHTVNTAVANAIANVNNWQGFAIGY